MRALKINIVLLVFIIATACATTGIGKAVQVAAVQKKLVETSAVEFVKLHLKNDPRITDEIYAKGKNAYQKWYLAQQGLATTLSTWKTVSSSENEARLLAALEAVNKSADVYLGLIAQFIDLRKLEEK